MSYTRKADELKSAIRPIMRSAEAPMKRFVVHYILWSQGKTGYPGTGNSGAFQCALDELVLEGFMTANKTARGVTYERNPVTATEPDSERQYIYEL